MLVPGFIVMGPDTSSQFDSETHLDCKCGRTPEISLIRPDDVPLALLQCQQHLPNRL